MTIRKMRRTNYCVIGSVGDGEELPATRDALEVVLAAIAELNARAGDQIGDRSGDQHFARAGKRANPCADVHADATDVVAPQLDLTGVEPGAQLEVERPGRAAQL